MREFIKTSFAINPRLDVSIDSSTPRLICQVITLNPAASNTQQLLRALTNQGLPAGLFPAVDGRSGYPELMPGEIRHDRLALLRHHKLLTPSELGCYLSHLRAVRQAYDSNAQFVCVLEDDVVLEPEFGSTVNALIPLNLDLVRLMALKLRRRKLLQEIVPGIHLARPERGTLGTQAYLLSRNGMKKFLDHASTIYEVIDGVLDHFYLFDLDSYLVEPHVAYELTGQSSVMKQHLSVAQPPSLFDKLAYHPVKLYFSWRRHWYLLRRHRDYYPATFPDQRTGKSQRLRGKGAAAKILQEK